MKLILKIVIAIITLIILTIIVITFLTNNSIRDAFNTKNLKPSNFVSNNNLNKIQIQKINFTQIDSIIKSKKGFKHIYLFSYYCSPCRESIKRNKCNFAEVNDSFLEIENTLLVSCDYYGAIDKLEELLKNSSAKKVFILDNDSFVSSKFNNFERLKTFLSRHYPKNFNEKMYGYPYNIVFDSSNKVISSYPGGFQ